MKVEIVELHVTHSATTNHSDTEYNKLTTVLWVEDGSRFSRWRKFASLDEMRTETNRLQHHYASVWQLPVEVKNLVAPWDKL